MKFFIILLIVLIALTSSSKITSQQLFSKINSEYKNDSTQNTKIKNKSEKLNSLFLNSETSSPKKKKNKMSLFENDIDEIINKNQPEQNIMFGKQIHKDLSIHDKQKNQREEDHNVNF